jgi:hypothetical protein
MIFHSLNEFLKPPKFYQVLSIKHRLAVFRSLQLEFCLTYELVPYIKSEHFAVIYMTVPSPSTLVPIGLLKSLSESATAVLLFSVFFYLTKHSLFTFS